MRRYRSASYTGVRNTMLETNGQQKPTTHDEVRIRSNVCTNPNAWYPCPVAIVRVCAPRLTSCYQVRLEGRFRVPSRIIMTEQNSTSPT
jgi:hypothetical protein